MSELKIIGESISNLPWSEPKTANTEVMWRYDHNPIIQRDVIPSSNSIFNSAVVTFNGGFAGVFRIDDRCRYQRLHTGFSDDGINWQITEEPIKFISEEPSAGDFMHGYDPRVVFLEDRWYVMWCNINNGPTIGLGYTFDFKEFHQLPNAFLPFNRNGVLFPKKINGKYALLSRPSDNGHTPFGDIYYSESPDMRHWGYHRQVMSASDGWQATKIGAGPIPIETSEGWLLLYHGVLTSCNGFVYSFGGALLDLDEPWKVIARNNSYIMSPQAPYELMGDVPNVVFPCASLVDAPSGRMALYYGCADTTVGLAFGHIKDIIEHIKSK